MPAPRHRYRDICIISWYRNGATTLFCASIESLARSCYTGIDYTTITRNREPGNNAARVCERFHVPTIFQLSFSSHFRATYLPTYQVSHAVPVIRSKIIQLTSGIFFLHFLSIFHHNAVENQQSLRTPLHTTPCLFKCLCKLNCTIIICFSDFRNTVSHYSNICKCIFFMPCYSS